MNEFLKAMKEDMNYTLTENSGITHKSTMSDVLDMFAMGGSMRSRSDNDVIHMFKKAYEENSTLALRCLFYLRDVRGGAGERRFFRVCYKWLAENYYEEAKNLIPYVAEYGRYDDLFVLFDTPIKIDMLMYIDKIIHENKDPLIYKWMPSINASSLNSKKMGREFASYFKMTEREYRRLLSWGRKACNLVETLMSQQKWDQIAFDKLPSKAGLLYKNAFMRREETKDRYTKFMSDKNTKVNAGVLNPVNIAHQIFAYNDWHKPEKTEREAWQKYWDNLKDYYNGREEPGIAVVDVSGSMAGLPMDAAVSMGAYIAERGKGPFKNHFITFDTIPELVNFTGVDIYDKFQRARNADWGGTTNIEAVFDLLLSTALRHHVKPEDMPKTLYIFSDMEFNRALTTNNSYIKDGEIDTVIEAQIRKWHQYDYYAPRVIFWDLDARQNNIPAIGPKFSYVSGFSMNMVECILSEKDGYDLMLEKLNSDRYSCLESIYDKN